MGGPLVPILSFLAKSQYSLSMALAMLNLWFNYKNRKWKNLSLSTKMFSKGKYFTVWLRNRLISRGLKSVHSQTEKSSIATYNRQFPTVIEIKIIKLIAVLLLWAFGLVWLSKRGIILWFSLLLSAQNCLQYDAINNYHTLYCFLLEFQNISLLLSLLLRYLNWIIVLVYISV